MNERMYVLEVRIKRYGNKPNASVAKYIVRQMIFVL